MHSKLNTVAIKQIIKQLICWRKKIIYTEIDKLVHALLNSLSLNFFSHSNNSFALLW